MRVVIAVAIVLLLLAVGVREAAWRVDHPLTNLPLAAPGGGKVAEIRFLTEGSAVPYGRGVFLRPSWHPLASLQSELAFAGYCGKLTADWPAPRRLSVNCELLAGEPVLPGPVIDGVAVEVTLQRRHARSPGAAGELVSAQSLR